MLQDATVKGMYEMGNLVIFERTEGAIEVPEASLSNTDGQVPPSRKYILPGFTSKGTGSHYDAILSPLRFSFSTSVVRFRLRRVAARFLFPEVFCKACRINSFSNSLTA